MNPSPMTTAERELTDAEIKRRIQDAWYADADARGTLAPTDPVTRREIVAYRAGWQARAGYAAPPREPTEAMLNAARDWSHKLYSQPIGSGAATGCWQAMYDAAPSPPGPSDEANQGAVPVAQPVGPEGPYLWACMRALSEYKMPYPYSCDVCGKGPCKRDYPVSREGLGDAGEK